MLFFDSVFKLKQLVAAQVGFVKQHEGGEAGRWSMGPKRESFNLRRTSGVAGDPRGTLLVIISKTIWNFFMGFQICLKHLKICHMPKFHKISLISNYVIKA